MLRNKAQLNSCIDIGREGQTPTQSATKATRNASKHYGRLQEGNSRGHARQQFKISPLVIQSGTQPSERDTRGAPDRADRDGALSGGSKQTGASTANVNIYLTAEKPHPRQHQSLHFSEKKRPVIKKDHIQFCSPPHQNLGQNSQPNRPPQP